MNLISAFTIPIFNSIYPEFEDKRHDFFECINNFMQKKDTKSNNLHVINGFQSINITKESALEPLFNYICQLAYMATQELRFMPCKIFITSAWFNFNKGRTDYILDHSHPDTFSGVFYLKASEDSGKLYITNPGLNNSWQGNYLVESKNGYNSDSIKIEPEEGQIFLWPSYLRHYVETNKHDDDIRISISFNIICLPKSDDGDTPDLN